MKGRKQAEKALHITSDDLEEIRGGKEEKVYAEILQILDSYPLLQVSVFGHNLSRLPPNLISISVRTAS